MDRTDQDSTITIVDDSRPAKRPASERPGYIQVEVIGGPMDGSRRRIAGVSFVVGRGDSNDLPLPLDTRVSKRHSRITREGDHYWLEDLDSRNGTYVGDARVRGRTLIGSGTIFTIGATSLEFTPD